MDVLADEAIRTGVKDFSQWPTIPQLYVCGEFIGGSDIMIEMYQNGELGEMIEKVRTSFLYNNNINKITIGIIRRIANEAVGMEWNEINNMRGGEYGNIPQSCSKLFTYTNVK